MTSKGNRVLENIPSPIRIVPMLGPDYKRPPLPGHPPVGLGYYGGPLISSVQIYTLYWGTAWQGTLSNQVTQINQFFQYIVTSSLIDQLSEYSVPGYPIGHGAFVNSKTVNSDPPATVTDAQIQDFVNQNKGLHPPSNNQLYFVFLPPGVMVSLGNGVSCGPPPNGFCGYHSDIAQTTFYAVVPYPSCAGCGGSFTTFDAITMFSSHELCEAITDPIAPTGWYGQVQNQQGEIGDFCNQQPKSVGGYNVQKMWSNANVGCV